MHGFISLLNISYFVHAATNTHRLRFARFCCSCVLNASWKIIKYLQRSTSKLGIAIFNQLLAEINRLRAKLNETLKSHDSKGTESLHKVMKN